MQSLQELEQKLGDPKNFVPTPELIPVLIEWAITIGMDRLTVHAMNGVELTNAYHRFGGSTINQPTDDQKKNAEILHSVITSLIQPEYIRKIVNEELEKNHAKIIEIKIDDRKIRIDDFTHYATEMVLRIVAMNHPIMMIGPAGCGKTSIAESVAKILELPFYITNAINETFELTGFIDGYGKYHSTPFRQAFEFGGVWIADEIDAWDAPALLAANSALANGYTMFPDRNEPVRRHENFRMVATANTFGNGASRIYVGRNELDAASLDRFATVDVDYDLNLERILCGGNQEWLEYVWKVRKEVARLKIRHVVSTRAIIMGGAALSSGMDRTDVEKIYLFKGMSENDRDKLDLDE